jgi:ankyrin repeat protein
MMPGERECWIRHGHTDDSPNLELNLLSAAAHFGHVSLADELLRDGHSPTGSNNIFASPLFLAAYAGNMEMVKLLLDHMPEGIANGRILTKHEAQGIDGALQSGNLDMVRLAAFPPLGISPDPSPDWHQVPYSVEHLRNRIETTKSPEVYHYVQDLTPDFPLSESWKAKILATHAEYGNLEMVRCLLDEGVPWNNSRINGAPLVVAADLSQEKVVELLIERGADPNFIGNGSQRGTPLCAAAACGSLSIVRKLLDNGARIGSDYDRALRYAVLREHTAMVEFLIKHNPLNESTRSTLKWIASSSSLDSMVELLERLDRGMSPPSS